MINDFHGSCLFLSNFFMHSIMYEGILYPSNEHAFQAAKSLDKAARLKIAALPTASMAKKAGRGKNPDIKFELREDWDVVKLDIMYTLCKEKFSDPVLASKLKATGNEELVEGNWWGDTYWGVCKGVGSNHLGKILMQVRDELSIN